MRFIVLLFVFIGFSAECQSLRDINFSYLYSQADPFTFRINPVRKGEVWHVYYQLTLRDTTTEASGYSIQFELRDGMNSKESQPVSMTDVERFADLRSAIEGRVNLSNLPGIQLLVAKVKKGEKVWMFYTILEPKFPVNGYLTKSDKVGFERYVYVGSSATVFKDKVTHIAWYNDAFPPATPAFAEAAARVAPAIKPDSIWMVGPGETVTFPKKGLYLLQTDTTASEGFTVRAEVDYPRITTVESLADPLTYICTSQELARVRQAKGDKKAFDRVILSITQDQDRARQFMKSYYRRVEIANQLFTSYKEGWKTDRGMIYIVFGLPDQVFRTSDRELWYFKNSDFKIEFEFVKSPTLFDPENYVLIRQKKFDTTVYEVIDLWRNARF
jgi:GWxTD domain-containing protein